METIITINLIATIILGIAILKAKSIISKKKDSSDDYLIFKIEAEFSEIESLIKKEFSAIKKEIELSKKKITSNQTELSQNQNLLYYQFNNTIDKLEKLELIMKPIADAKELLYAQNSAYYELKKKHDILMGQKADKHLQEQIKAISQDRNNLQEQVHQLKEKLKAYPSFQERFFNDKAVKVESVKKTKSKENNKVDSPAKKINSKK